MSCSLTQQRCIPWRDPGRRDASREAHRLFPQVGFTGPSQAALAVAYFDTNDKGLQPIRNYMDHCHGLQQGRDFAPHWRCPLAFSIRQMSIPFAPSHLEKPTPGVHAQTLAIARAGPDGEGTN